MSGPTRTPFDLLEAYFAPMSRGDDALFEAARGEWRKLRLEHRRATRISSTSLPAVSEAAQEIELSRNAARGVVAHAERAMLALGQISSGRPRDEEPSR